MFWFVFISSADSGNTTAWGTIGLPNYYTAWPNTLGNKKLTKYADLICDTSLCLSNRTHQQETQQEKCYDTSHEGFWQRLVKCSSFDYTPTLSTKTDTRVSVRTSSVTRDISRDVWDTNCLQANKAHILSCLGHKLFTNKWSTNLKPGIFLFVSIMAFHLIIQEPLNFQQI